MPISAAFVPPREVVSLEDAKTFLEERISDGVKCPCCGQFAKVYRRKVTSSMARMLIRMWRHAGRDWVHLPDLRDGNGAMDTTMTKYWWLIEEERKLRPDGGRAGYWRLTEHGQNFVLGSLRIHKYALTYDDRCLGHEGEMITIRDALGTNFDYNDLMAGR